MLSRICFLSFHSFCNMEIWEHFTKLPKRPGGQHGQGCQVQHTRFSRRQKMAAAQARLLRLDSQHLEPKACTIGHRCLRIVGSKTDDPNMCRGLHQHSTGSSSTSASIIPKSRSTGWMNLTRADSHTPQHKGAEMPQTKFLR